jgi:hypothetical protein
MVLYYFYIWNIYNMAQNWKIQANTTGRLGSPFNTSSDSEKQKYRLEKYGDQVLKLSNGQTIQVLKTPPFGRYLKINNENVYKYKIIPDNVDLEMPEVKEWLNKFLLVNDKCTYILKDSGFTVNPAVKSYNIIAKGSKLTNDLNEGIIYMNTYGCGSDDERVIEEDEYGNGELCRPVGSCLDATSGGKRRINTRKYKHRKMHKSIRKHKSKQRKSKTIRNKSKRGSRGKSRKM